jgi:hypothetical protein
VNELLGSVTQGGHFEQADKKQELTREKEPLSPA